MSCDRGIEGPLKEGIGLEEGGILCCAFEVFWGRLACGTLACSSCTSADYSLINVWKGSCPEGMICHSFSYLYWFSANTNFR